MNITYKSTLISTGSIYAIGLSLLVLTTVHAVPEETDNAALFYYQALLLCPEQDSFPQEVVRTAYNSDKFNENIDQYRKYVKDYQHVIQLMQSASKLKRCNWAVPDSIESEVVAMHIPLTRSISFLITLNSIVLAADGEYKAALNQCLIPRRVARHIADYPGHLYSIPVIIERATVFSVNYILDIMPPDEITLKWLLGQLEAEPLISELLSTKVRRDFERKIHKLSKDEAFLSYFRKKLLKKATNKEQTNKILGFTDEELIRMIREPYIKFLDSFLIELDNPKPFEQKYAMLRKLSEGYTKQDKNNPAIVTTLKTDAETLPSFYGIQIAHTARFNAIKAAIKIYSLKAKTNQLPKTLPDSLPKDPLTGKDFEYKITEEGFMLSSSCKSKDILMYIVPEYKFKVMNI